VFSPLHFANKQKKTHTHISGTCKITKMNVLMFFQTTLYNDCLITPVSYLHISHITSIHVLTTSHPLVSYETNLSSECFITYLTALHKLTSMFACMVYQITLFSEYPITHITNIRALSMYALMCYQRPP
jgi:hypothetical protein